MHNSTFFSSAYKSIIAFLVVILLAVGSFSACDEIELPIYSIDTTEFNSQVVHGEEVDLTGLVLISKLPIGDLTVQVTPEMIVESDSTEGAGVKTFVVSYSGQQFTVEFEVKYKVDFVVNEKVVSTQLVSSSEELVAPEVVPEPGYNFVGWDTDFASAELNDNLTINAVFEEVEYPEIGDLTATYGDTLGDIVLPSNDIGHWEFIKELETSVGDAGRNRFGVRFVLEDGTVIKNATVSVTVKKQVVDFTDIVDSFIYDGKEHFPTYSLDQELDLEVIVIGHPEINAGAYEFTLEIDDKNYSGEYTGKYTIAKPDVTVTVSNATIKYGDAVPEFTFTVEGFEDVELLGVSIKAPGFASTTGVFDITATVSNTNVNATVVNGTLTVEKADYQPQPPVFGTATFGDPLSSLDFEPVAMGKWVWENPELVIDDITGFDAWAVFIPENSNHAEVRELITITDIIKRQLTINVVESSFVYSEGATYSIIYVVEDGSYTDVTVVGNTFESNAGTYLRTLEIVDDRYFGSVAVDLVIEKATPDVKFDFILEGVWRPGIQLGDIVLPENYKWDAPGTVITNAGEAQYSARYDLEDPNYSVPTGVITVKLDRAEGKISGAQEFYERLYDGSVFVIPGIMANHAESALVYEYLLDGELVSEINAAGVYNVTVTLPETANYTGASVTLTVTIHRADNLDSVITIQNATYLDKLSSLILPTSTIGTWSWKDADESTTVGYVGTNTFVAVFTPINGNYNAKEVEVTVNVAKKAITAIPTLNASSFVYTGDFIAPEIIGADESLYAIFNDGGVDVGSYAVTFILIDPDNYKWFDSDDADKTISYSITKAQAIISGLAINGWIYGGGENAPTAESTFGDITFVYSSTFGGEYTPVVPTNAGTHYVKALVEGSDNYNGAVSEPVSFVIAKAIVDTLPTVIDDALVYTGAVIYPTLDGVVDSLYTVTNEGGVNVGNYTVTLTLVDPTNYKWSDSEAATKTLGYSIVKAQAEISDLAIDGWTYGESANAPTAYTTFGTLSYVYSATENGEYTATKPTNAGTYFVKAIVAGTANYNGAESDPISFSIAKAAASITGLNPTYALTYTGEAFSITGIGRSHSESELVYTINDEAVAKISVTDAGFYVVFVTLPESANYLEAVAKATITVSPAENSIDYVETNQSATYLDKLTALTLPVSNVGTWTWKDADDNTTVGNVGTHTFVAVFTPATGNYLPKEVEVTVTVAKKAISVLPTLSANSFVYTGETLKPEIIGADETLYTVTNAGGVNVGSYFVALTLIDTDNYKWSDSDSATKTLGYSITKAQAVISGLTINGWTYGEEANAPTANTTFGTVIFVYSATYAGEYTATVPTLAGNYYVKAIVEGTENFGGATGEPVSFAIAKAVVEDLPTLDSNEFIYTGTTLKPTLEGVNESLYSVTNDGAINVGGYFVTLTLKDSANYKWSDSDSATKTLGYSIVKAQAVISGLAIEGWTYGMSANAPTANTTFGTVRFVYSASVDGEYTATVPTLAGTYYVKATVAGAANYNGAESEPLEFSIAKASASITGLDSSYEFIFNGEAYVITGLGRPHNESGFVYTVNGEVVDAIRVTDAGVYTVVVTLPESANYLEATAEATVTILAAENNVDTVNTNQSAIYLDKLSTLALPESAIGTWTWKDADENTTVGNVGTNVFVAVFTPANGNYLAKEVEVTVTVAKKAINLPIVSDKEYTGEYISSGLVTNDIYVVTDDNGGVDSGVYSVKVTLADPANYRWSTTADVTVTIEYQIAAAINSWDVIPDIKDVTYGETLVVNGQAAYGDIEVWYKLTGADDSEYSKSVPTAAGEYTAKFITVDDNYTILTQLVTFKISKKVVNLPALSINAITYTGETLKPELVGADETLYTVTNEGGVDVGNYLVILTLIDTDNYKWSDSDEATKTLGYAITKAQAVISDLAIEGWTFGENAKLPTASTTFGTVSFVYSATFGGEYTANIPALAGTFYVKAVVEGTDNYFGDESDAISFTIAKAGVSLPTLDKSEITYTGTTVKPTIEGADEALYSVTNLGGVDVGTYFVTLTLKDSANYKWADSNESTVEIAYEIVKADAVISDLTLEGWTYGQSASVPSANTTFGSVSFVYSASIDGEYIATVPTLAGTYYVKATVAGAANYNGAESEPLEFSIAKASASITGLDFSYEFIFNGVEYVITGLGRPHNESSFVYTVNGEIVEDIRVTDAGVYTVVVTLPESANYLEATAEATVTILAAENNVDTVNTNQSATYLDKLSTLALPESSIGTWTWKDADENTTVGNVGANVFVAVFTPANGNYLAKEVEVTVTVAKKAISALPTLSANSFVYTGETLKPEIIGADETLYTVTNDGGVNVGNYFVTLTLIDSANYKWSDSNEATKTLGYSITKAQAVISDLTINGWTYGEEANAPTANTTFGTVSFVYSATFGGEYTATVPTLAGTYYVKAVVDGTDNYNGETSEAAQFTIAKATVTVPTLSSYALPYTGSVVKATLVGADETLYSITNNGGTYAGDHCTVVLTLKDTANYKWADTDDAATTISYEIVKADAVISGFVIEGWAYGESAKAPIANTTFGTVTFTYSSTADGEFTAVVPTNVGTHYVKATVASAANWNGAEEVISFTISKASASITGLDSSYEFIFNGEAYVITGLGRPHNESSFVYTVNGEIVEDIRVTDAGTYTVVVTLPETANYLEATATTTITVLAAENTIDSVITTQSATYLDKLSTLHLPTSAIGTWSWKDADASTTVGNAGANTFIALFTPANSNYLAKEVAVTVNVAKLSVTAIPSLTQNSFVYTGSVIEPALNGVDSTLYTVTYPGSVNVGNYVITLTLTNPESSMWYDSESATRTISYSITKGAPNFTEFSIPATEYGATIVPSVKVSFGSVVVLYATSEDGEYTTTVPTEIGQYWAKAVIEETANYSAATAGPVSFNIGKATPTVSFNPTSPSNGGAFYQNLLNVKGDTVATDKKGNVVAGTISNWTVTFNTAENGANSTYSFIFKPTDTTHYNETTVNGTINLKTVATIGLNGTAYGTIEDALRASKSGDTVWVKTDNTGNVYITEKEVNIPQGVTLLLPYGDASNANGRNQGAESTLQINTETGLYMTPAKNHPEYRQTVVKLAEGVVLTVSGTLEISGELTGGGGGNMAGHTAGKYAELLLQHNAKIVIGGKALVYGYINNEDDSGDPGTLITVNNGGSLSQPFTLIDFKGGSLLKGIQGALSSSKNHPFAQYKFMNVNVESRYEYGSKLMAWANLDTSKLIGSGSQHNHKEVIFIGVDGVIELTNVEYSYLVAKYNSQTEITTLKVYGGAKNNALALTVSAAGTNVTVSSKDYFFPLSWLYDITFDNAPGQTTTAQFTMDYYYKIMPGSKLTIEEGAMLTINELSIYDVFVDPVYNTDNGAVTCPYPTVYPASSSLSGQTLAPGKLIVRGSLVANVIGGDVYTDCDGASVKVNNATTITTKEVEKHHGSSLSASVDSHISITKTLKLIFNNELTSFEMGETYKTVNSVWTKVIDYISVKIPNGLKYIAEQPIVIDENGMSYGDPISGTAGENTVIMVLRGSKITLTLGAGQIVTAETSLTLNSIDEYNALASEHTADMYPLDDGELKFATVPMFNITVSSLDSFSITYMNIGSESVYASLNATKAYSKSGNTGIQVSITVTGIEDSRVTGATNAGNGKFTASGNDAVTVAVSFNLSQSDVETAITLTGKVDSQGSNNCVTPDSMITLADGTQVRVDSLTGDELLLVWNLETGMLDYAPIMFVDSDAVAEFEVIYLYFSDGTVVKVIGEHGFWDYELNRYVYLDKNAADYIGHTFARQNGDELAKVQLVNVEIKTEMTSAWSPVTVGHLCYFVNGMLTMPGGVGGLFNIFEVDAETMTYDYEAIARDIETYGLFTYEELNAICPLTEDMFYAAGGQYLKISIGKGNLTMEELIYMIERYSIYV